MAITPEEFNNVCAEFGLIRMDEQKHDPTSGWWVFPAKVTMRYVKSIVKYPEIAEWNTQYNEPIVFKSKSEHLGDGLKPKTIEDLRKSLEDAYAFWKKAALAYQKKSINDVLKNLD